MIVSLLLYILMHAQREKKLIKFNLKPSACNVSIKTKYPHYNIQ